MAVQVRFRFEMIPSLALAFLLGLAAAPAHAQLGALFKLGSLAGKGAAVGKGVAAGAGAVAGAEALEGAAQAARVARTGAATAEGGAAATSAEQLAKASGLGKAVPDEVFNMLSTPGKTLFDVPDSGTRAWLSLPRAELTSADTIPMVSDYARLLEGRAAAGPARQAATRQAIGSAPQLPSTVAPAQVPWHAIELIARAAHLGNRGAQTEFERLCTTPAPPRALPAPCLRAGNIQLAKP